MNRACLLLTAAAIGWCLPSTAVTAAESPQRKAAACTLITTVKQLQAMRDNPSGSYCLGNDIDASAKTNFVPVGDPVGGLFTGHFDGRGFAIENLRIHSSANYVGLFGITDNAVIKNVSLLNIRIISSGSTADTGGLVGLLDGNGGATAVSGVRVTGTVNCSASTCHAGGMVGGTNGTGTINVSSSAASVASTSTAGGIGGLFGNSTISRSYATGAVTCTALNCVAGGLVGRWSGGSAVLSFATGPVTGADGTSSRTGGLIGLTEAGTTISHCYAASRVIGGSAGFAAGLIAQHNSNGDIRQTYAVGTVSSTGAMLGGLIGNAGGSPSITRSYWDTETTEQAASAAGTGLTTAQLRAHLPAGFDANWAITKNLSYPFINAAGIDFTSPLATLVQFQLPYVFLPINQFDLWEYLTAPAHADQAALATVYTVIARAFGVTPGDPRLDGVKVDQYFWHDASQTTTWQGPVRDFAALGPLVTIPAATPLDNSNVIGAMNSEKLAILRGAYKKGDGTTATHWLLGTLYTRNPDNSFSAVIAHDPFTGKQISIDPITKKVIAPADFPLANFKVDGYRKVTLRLPISDRRLKRDIVAVDRLDNGLRLYRYRYLWSNKLYVGVMAQEVATVRPDAVVMAPDGYLRVNYGRLGLHLQTWKEWHKASKRESRSNRIRPAREARQSGVARPL